MATVTEVGEMREDDVLLFGAYIDYDDQTGLVSAVRTDNPGDRDWELRIITPPVVDWSYMSAAGEGEVTNHVVPEGTAIDVVDGAGYQLNPQSR